MRHVIVRYTVDPARLAEHEALLASVFTELGQQQPAGLRYEVLKAPDGVGFTHVATIQGDNPLVALASFRAFTKDIASRCTAPPATSESTCFGAYAGS